MLIHDVENILDRITNKFEGTFWLVGGSAALVLQGIFYSARDIDIIQHSGKRISLGNNFEKRMWSYYYSDQKLDLHYSNPFCTEYYEPTFHKIVAALYYIDSAHSYLYKTFRVVSPLGAGLINWVHHFLPYGYDPARTFEPKDEDRENLMAILTPECYQTISWKVENEAVDNKKLTEHFKSQVEAWTVKNSIQ